MPLLSPNQQCQNTEGIKCKCKGKVNRAPQESIGGAQLPLPGFEPVGGEPLMSVTQGHFQDLFQRRFTAMRAY